MTSWPLTKQGNYGTGTTCDGDEYDTEFDAIYDALNQLFERFSTVEVNGTFTDRVTAATTDWDPSFNDNEERVIKVIQLPSWAQGWRLRSFSVTNCSNVNDGAGETYVSGSFVCGIATASSLANLSAANWTNATELSTVTFNTTAELNGSSGGTPNPTPAMIENTGLNRVVVPAVYVAFFVKQTATVVFNAAIDDSHFQFNFSALFDAMVPVP